MVRNQLREAEAHAIDQDHQQEHGPTQRAHRRDNRGDQHAKLAHEPKEPYEADNPYQTQDAQQPRHAQVLLQVVRRRFGPHGRKHHLDLLHQNDCEIEEIPSPTGFREEAEASRGHAHDHLAGEQDAEENFHRPEGRWLDLRLQPGRIVRLGAKRQGVQNDEDAEAPIEVGVPHASLELHAEPACKAMRRHVEIRCGGVDECGLVPLAASEGGHELAHRLLRPGLRVVHLCGGTARRLLTAPRGSCAAAREPGLSRTRRGR
mmetsp:Transcript_45700/g.131803  ORF Transcript_45700/g.131803 Transcript_45700/m.131803 type:complete len:261 (+) Transcript_45700:834-1616(+)